MTLTEFVSAAETAKSAPAMEIPASMPAWAVFGLRAPAEGETPPNAEEILTMLRQAE